MDIYAHPAHLHEWSAGKQRSRWDYDCPDYTLDEMRTAGNRLFARVTHMLRAGDLIYVTDGANARATFIVNWVDTTAHAVAWDIDATHREEIVTSAAQPYALRWRGVRGGGFAIVDAAGTIIARDIPSRDEANRRLANMIEAKAA